MKFIEFTTKRQSFRTFVVFDNIVQILDRFRKFIRIRSTIGSGLKQVATGSVPKRYQTRLLAQLSKTLLRNASFHINCPIFNIQNFKLNL